MSYLKGGLKDLGDTEPEQRREGRSLRRRAQSSQRPQPSQGNAEPRETGRQVPVGLGSDPLSQARRQPAGQSTVPEPTAAAAETSGNRSSLVDSITALFSELGTAAEERPAENHETNDVTENLLRALNQSADFDGTVDDEMVGNVLAENVMKQLLMKSILHEPMKDFRERYVEWLRSEAANRISDQERQRHRNMIDALDELLEVYETDPDNFQRITELFIKSQSFGEPPSVLFEPLTEDALRDTEPEDLQQCLQQ